LTEAKIYSVNLTHLYGVGGDEDVDVGFQLSGGTMYAALQLASRQLCKPPLDLVDPGC